MQRIVIDLYDHTTEDEVAEIIETLKSVGLDDARHERVSEERVAPFTHAQLAVRERVWRNAQAHAPTTLDGNEVADLWDTILSGSIAARAFTGPRT